MKLRDNKVAALFIPGVPCWDGYPRALFMDDLGDFSRRILSAGGEIYRYDLFFFTLFCNVAD